MQLTTQQSHVLFEKHGCYVTEVCDKCGQVLGPVRFKLKGGSGVWCSPNYRGDGNRDVIRRGGRPKKFDSGAERQREYRSRRRCYETPSQPGGNKELTNARNGSLALRHSPNGSRLESPLMRKSNGEQFPQTA
jgi:hypothetical protein